MRVKSHITDTISTQCKNLSLVQTVGQRILHAVGSMDDILKWSRIALQIGCSTQGIVVQSQHTDTVIDLLGCISGHTNDFSEQIRNRSMVGSPLYGINAFSVLQRFQSQFEIAVFFFNLYRSHRTVLIFQPVFTATEAGFRWVIITFLLTAVQCQQWRRLVCRTKIPVSLCPVPHPYNISFRININTEIIRIE